MLPSADSITRQVTSGGGSGVDLKRTKKNTLVAVDNNLEMKIDTLQVKPTKEAQTGELLDGEWKEGLEKFDLLNDDNDMDENSESSKLQFSMTTDAAPNVNKRFTALNFIISVQYKTNIYTVLYCADYISYP